MPYTENTDLKKENINDDDDFIQQFGKMSVKEKQATTEADGYETDTEIKPKKMRLRRRLEVGAGDFSFMSALIKKQQEHYPDFAKSIIATVYEKNKNELVEKYPDSVETNIEYLRNVGATLHINADARRLHHYKNFQGKRFERIHFNCPHDGSDYKEQTLPPIIRDFFASAKTLQQEGDRIHMALPKPPGTEYNKFYKAYIYDVYNAARNAGYRLMTKREFGSDRFPGYEHKETKKNQSAAVTENLREYIFEKTSLTSEQILEQYPKTIWKNKYNSSIWKYCLDEPATDTDSSDYLTTDSESETNSVAMTPTLKKAA